MNREVFESASPFDRSRPGNPYGGYSGGQDRATGLPWKSIEATTIRRRAQTGLRAGGTVIRRCGKLRDRLVWKADGKPYFVCDAVLDTNSRQISARRNGGRGSEGVLALADKRTYVPWAKKYDVMVFGMPQEFNYGNGMGITRSSSSGDQRPDHPTQTRSGGQPGHHLFLALQRLLP